MAQAQTIKFGKSFILLGDLPDGEGEGESEEFTAPCGFEELTMTVNFETNNVNIPDCDDPDLAAWIATDIVSQQMTLQGSGILDITAMKMWQDWWLDYGAAERNVRFFRDLTTGNHGGHFQAPAVLTNYEETGQRGQRWRNTVTIALNGKPTFTPVS